MKHRTFPRRFTRRATLAALAASCLWAGATGARADTYPDRPITLLVGFAPGGAADVVARQLAEEMSKQLGQRVNVDNKSGASGNLATLAMMSAPADGYTLLLAAIHLATNPALAGVKYDTRADLTMVSQVTSVPVVLLTGAGSPLKTPGDIAEASRKVDGGLKVGSGGIGTSSHLAMELFARSQKLAFVHVPYRGGAPANQALMAGETDLMFDLMSGGLKSMVDGGRVKPVAVMQDQRLPALPDVKSAKEWGLPESTHIRTWQGIAVKGGTPKPIVARLHKAVVAAANSPAFIARVEQLGSTLTTSKSPEEFQKFYLSELDRWGSLIKAANIKPE